MKNNIQEELEEFAPFLAKIKAKEQVRQGDLPANYFTTLEHNILARAKAEEAVANWGATAEPTAERTTPKVKTVPWWTKLLSSPKFTLGFSMVILVVIVLTVFWQPTSTSQSLAETVEMPSTEELLTYVNNNIEEFSEDLLAETAAETLVDIDLNANLDIEEEALRNYMEENFGDFDAELIEEELY